MKRSGSSGMNWALPATSPILECRHASHRHPLSDPAGNQHLRILAKGFQRCVYPAYSPSEKAAYPEKVNAFEVGFKHQQRGFSFDLAGFYYKYRDMQYNWQVSTTLAEVWEATWVGHLHNEGNGLAVNTTGGQG